MAREGFSYYDGSSETDRKSVTKPHTFRHNGVDLFAHVVDRTVVGEVSDKIVVGDNQTVLSTEVATRITDVIDQTHALERAGRGVDCYSFGVLFAGGEFPSTPRIEYDRQYISHNIRISATHAVVEQDIDAQLPDMHLLGLGTPDSDGRFMPDHILVKIQSDETQESLYVSKLTKGPVVFADLSGLAGFYHSSHVAVIDSLSLTRRDTGEIVGKYQS